MGGQIRPNGPSPALAGALLVLSCRTAPIPVPAPPPVPEPPRWELFARTQSGELRPAGRYPGDIGELSAGERLAAAPVGQWAAPQAEIAGTDLREAPRGRGHCPWAPLVRRRQAGRADEGDGALAAPGPDLCQSLPDARHRRGGRAARGHPVAQERGPRRHLRLRCHSPGVGGGATARGARSLRHRHHRRRPGGAGCEAAPPGALGLGHRARRPHHCDPRREG